MTERERAAGGPRARRRPPKAAARETVDVRTSDGWHLRADLDEPDGEPVGTAVLAHAMMARRSEFDRPHGPRPAGLRQRLIDRGWRVIAFDFRGHGDSGPRPDEGGRYTYDDFVARDLPAVFDFARGSDRRCGRLVLVGHSLGGNAGLAAQGAGLVAFDRIVAVAASLWMPQFERSAVRWAFRRAVMSAAARGATRVGRFPARVLRLGSDDASRECFEDFARFARTGRWTSADGRTDYLASLARVNVPVMQIVSAGDRFACSPENGRQFVDRCAGPREVVTVTQADDGGLAPGHMGIVTSGRIDSVWHRVEAWMRTEPNAT